MERIPGLDAWLTRGPEEVEHHPRCPNHDDYRRDNCMDPDDDYCEHGLDEECICAELDAEARANKAEAKADELRERKYNP